MERLSQFFFLFFSGNIGSKNDIILDDDTLLLSTSYCDVTLSRAITKNDLWKRWFLVFTILPISICVYLSLLLILIMP